MPTSALPYHPNVPIAEPRTPSPTLESEAAPKTDWWSLAMKIGAPLIGAAVAGKPGLRAGTAFSTGVVDEEQRREKARIEAEDRKRAQDLIKQKREELAQAKAEAKARQDAEDERKRQEAAEKARVAKIRDLNNRREVAKTAKDYPEVERLTNEIDKLEGGEGKSGGALATQLKAEDEKKAEKETQDKKMAKLREASVARQARLQEAQIKEMESKGSPKPRTEAELRRIIRDGIVQIRQTQNTMKEYAKDGIENPYAVSDKETIEFYQGQVKEAQAELATRGASEEKEPPPKEPPPKEPPPIAGPPTPDYIKRDKGYVSPNLAAPDTVQKSALPKPAVTDTTDVTPEEYSTLQTVVANFTKNGLTPQQIRAKLVARKVGEGTLKRLGL